MKAALAGHFAARGRPGLRQGAEQPAPCTYAAVVLSPPKKPDASAREHNLLTAQKLVTRSIAPLNNKAKKNPSNWER